MERYTDHGQADHETGEKLKMPSVVHFALILKTIVTIGHGSDGAVIGLFVRVHDFAKGTHPYRSLLLFENIVAIKAFQYNCPLSSDQNIGIMNPSFCPNILFQLFMDLCQQKLQLIHAAGVAVYHPVSKARTW